MSKTELLLPKMGESVAEATIIKWLVEEGQAVEADEPLVEIATDKVDSEVPAPEDGVLIKRLVGEGDVVQVGQPIAEFGAEGDASSPTPVAAESAAPAVTEAKPEVVETLTAPLATAAVGKSGPSGRFYSPLVRNIAKQEGITMDELEAVAGSGQDGRVTKKDMLAYLDTRSNGTSAPVAAPAPTEKVAAPSNGTVKTPSKSSVPAAPPVAIGEGDEIEQMDRMRKLIADHMVMSKHTSPHVTSFVEADVTNLVNWRNKHKKAFFEKEGEKLTFTPIFMEAVAKAIKDMPGVNVSVDGDKIIKRKHINLGMATALPSGNLIVPVINDADQLNLVGLAKRVNDLASRARNNKLKPDEVSGGNINEALLRNKKVREVL